MATVGRKQVGPGETIASLWGNQVWDQSIQCFNSDADRRNQYATPHAGSVWWLDDVKILQMFDGTNVVSIPTGIGVGLSNPAVTYSPQNQWAVMGPLTANSPWGASPLLPVNAATTGVRIVIPGLYVAQATCIFTVPTLPRGVGVRQNGSTYIAQTTSDGTQPTWSASSPAEVFKCSAGDTIEGMVYQENAGTNSWNVGNQTMRVFRVG